MIMDQCLFFTYIAFIFTNHGQVDIAGVELHVDLLVDESLGLFVVVLPDLGSHDAIEEKVVEKVVIADCSTLSGVAIVPAVCLTVSLLLRISCAAANHVSSHTNNNAICQKFPTLTSAQIG